MTNTDSFIPFNRPSLQGKEIEYIQKSIFNGHLSGDGEFTKKCNLLLERSIGVNKCLLVTSCTHALEMAALLLDIKEGDEVILPSFTFVSTVNAFVLRGATPVFADIRPDTLNIDEKQLESIITEKTKVIVVVHYAGVACDMDSIMSTARKYGVNVVEDNAHGLFGKYKDNYLGSFGCLSTQSFHETKNFSCGEGGALLINDTQYIERAEIIREKGTNRSLFFRGQVDKYSWVDIGSSYLPSDMLAAFLFAQLESRYRIQEKRRLIWDTYYDQLVSWSLHHNVTLPTVPAHCEQAYHMFYMLMPTFSVRQNFIDYLKKRGILSVFHYLPLHLSIMGQKLGGCVGDCPVTENITDRLVRLPFFYDLTDAEQQKIIEAILAFSV